jgi:hypothetical protein
MNEILITTDSITIKGILLVSMIIFLYYLIIVGLTIMNVPRFLWP